MLAREEELVEKMLNKFHDSLLYLDMSFVNVDGIRELCLFADSLAKNNILLEEEDLPFFFLTR